MKDEALDFLVMAVLLAAVLALGLRTVMPMYTESRELSYETRQDKTVTRIKGEAVEYHVDDTEARSEYKWPVDANLDYFGTVLALSEQTYFMPKPRVLDVCGDVYSIQAKAEDAAVPEQPNQFIENATEYQPGTRGTLAKMQQSLYAWCQAATGRYVDSSGNAIDPLKLRFSIRFTTNELEDESDDCYSVYVLAIDQFGHERFLRCRSGGQIDNPGNFNIAYYK